jgi:hypothetical protein
MRQVTLEEVREAIRVRYDLPAFTTSTKPTLEQVDALINVSAQRLSAILSAFFGDDYFTSTSPIATVIDNSLTALPSNLYKLRSLIWLRATDDPVEIHRATLDDYAAESLLAARSWADEAPKYRFSGPGHVWWLPRPNAVYTVTCTYVYHPFVLTGDSDTVDAGPGWEEWVVNDVCVRLANIREEDPSVYMAERADCEQRIKLQAPQRDPYASHQVRDRRGARSGRDAGVWQSNGRRYGRWG